MTETVITRKQNYKGPNFSESEKPTVQKPFPKNFKFFGATTSAVGVEGAAFVDGKGLSNWDAFSKIPKKIRDGSTPEIACDHYRRFKEDIDLMALLGIQAYHFSISWPRVFPYGTGELNQKGLDFYSRMIDYLLVKGITPFVSAFHGDLPQALELKGGWLNRNLSDTFADVYINTISRTFGDRIQYWITINDPWRVSFFGYYKGLYPPGHKRNLKETLQVNHNLLLSHGKAVSSIRSNTKAGTEVGIALNLISAYPHGAHLADKAAAVRVDGFQNRTFLDPLFGKGYPMDMFYLYESAKVAPKIEPKDLEIISTPISFLGVNQYTCLSVSDNPKKGPLKAEIEKDPTGNYTLQKWVEYPKGVRDVLLRLKRDYLDKASNVKSIYITEFGSPYNDTFKDGQIKDFQRRVYMQEFLGWARQAMTSGVPLRGCFVRFFDDFSFDLGYTAKYGMVSVDRNTLKRTVKESGHWYSKLINDRVITLGNN